MALRRLSTTLKLQALQTRFFTPHNYVGKKNTANRLLNACDNKNISTTNQQLAHNNTADKEDDESHVKEDVERNETDKHPADPFEGAQLCLHICMYMYVYCVCVFGIFCKQCNRLCCNRRSVGVRSSHKVSEAEA